LGGICAQRQLQPDRLVGRRGDAEQGSDLVQRELTGAEGLADQGQVGEGVADPEQVGGGGEVEAGLDGVG
jgi:hypothetical protein